MLKTKSNYSFDEIDKLEAWELENNYYMMTKYFKQEVQNG